MNVKLQFFVVSGGFVACVITSGGTLWMMLEMLSSLTPSLRLRDGVPYTTLGPRDV